MDSIAFLGLKSSSYNDRLFFEMLEFKDDAQDWEDYHHKGHIKKEAKD
jgi:hypothetical protein